MYFCPKCSYSFDIKKSSGVSSSDDKKNELVKISEAIKYIKKDLSNYKPTFSKEELYKNNKYKKLSDSDKQALEVLFDSGEIGAEFSCGNCGFVREIKKSIRLYQLDKFSNNEVLQTLEDNKILFSDPALPRTRDYNCKNVNCITHKDKSKKEAVYYRDPKSYQLNYICGVCYFSWQI